MERREAAITEAREWLGTKWQHHQQTKGVAVDCVGLLMAAASVSGVNYGEIENYYRHPNGDALLNRFDSLFQRVELSDHQAGDILLFRFSGIPHHVGMLTSRDDMIHASFSARKVVEHPLDSFWQRRLVAIFNPFGDV